jgi:hypothetical protein
MDEIISYKMCAVKVRNAKLRNYLKREKLENITVPAGESMYNFVSKCSLTLKYVHAQPGS